MRLFSLVTVIVCVSVGAAWADATVSTLAELQQRLATAQRSHDLPVTFELVEDLKAYAGQHSGVAENLTLAKAALLAAEQQRRDYGDGEDTMDPRVRRLLGREIDVYAKLGLEALGGVPRDLSERWRIEADLYATMIRSSYKGNRYGDNMDRAVKRALELDPSNPNALVSAAKKPLFAEPVHGGDVPKALALLEKALEIDPGHERAIVFRGIAFEKLGDKEKAFADWNRALALNPHSQFALDKLAEYEP